jgi:TctA family transporter
MVGFGILVMFGLFGVAAAWDYKTGQVPVILLAVSVAWISYAAPFDVLAWLFAPILLLMLGVWSVIYELQKRGRLDPKKCYLGLADVVAIPWVFVICQMSFYVLGTAILAGVMAVEYPFMLRKRFRRFLPWLLPPAAAALLLGTLLA